MVTEVPPDKLWLSSMVIAAVLVGIVRVSAEKEAERALVLISSVVTHHITSSPVEMEGLPQERDWPSTGAMVETSSLGMSQTLPITEKKKSKYWYINFGFQC